MNNAKNYQTKQKIAINDIFINNPKIRFTAEEIMSILEREAKKVSKATLYRTLDNLVTSGQIIKDALDGNISCYQLKTCKCASNDQIHFRCEECGKILHIENTSIKKVDNKIEEQYGVTISNTKMMVYGVCKDCIGGTR